MDCLKNVIGISRTPCECLVNDLPNDYSDSKSGLYIDELPESPINLKSIKSIADCGKDMGFILTNSKNQAITEFKKEFFKQLQSQYKSNNQPFTGNVGSLYYSRVLPIEHVYAGVVLSAQRYSGASIALKKIHVAMDTTTTFDIQILKAYSGENNYELIATIPVESVAGGIKENVLNTPVELPLYDPTEKGINYYFLYQPSGFSPKDNAISCNCGQKENDLKSYVYPKGVVGSNLSNLNTFQNTSFANGILLNIEARCGTESIICTANENEVTKAAVEMAILYKAVEILIWAILNSSEINRNTMARREQLEASAFRLKGKFKNDVQWVAENIDLSNNDCYSCNNSRDLYFKAGIKA